MTSRLRIHNPRDYPPEVLDRLFVGRQPLLDEILDDLRTVAPGQSRQHWLLYAPRGFGKTHTLALIHHRTRHDHRLARRLISIWLPETAGLTAPSAAGLLDQIGDRLALTLSSDGDPLTPAFEEHLEEARGARSEPERFERLRAAISSAAGAKSKALVVLLENFDEFHRALSSGRSQRGEVEIGRFRSLLASETSLLFIASSPCRIPALSDPKARLYNMFKVREILPLSEGQTRDLLLRLQEASGEPEPLVADPVRVRVLHRLSGGSPRAVGLVFSAVASAGGVTDIVAEMQQLLDAQTPYFESRLTRHSPQERAIVRTLGLGRENLTAKQIAVASGLPDRSMSTLLERLVSEGTVVSTSEERGKGARYQLADGLYRMWIQFREGRRELEPLVRILALWLPESDLDRAAREFKQARSEISMIESDVGDSVLLNLDAALEFARSEEGRRAKAAIWDASERPETASGIGGKAAEHHRALQRGDDDERLRRPRALERLSTRNASRGQMTKAIECASRAVELWQELATTRPDKYSRDLARSLTRLSGLHAAAGRMREALAAIQHAVEIRERLARTNPAAFEPDLATSLNILSNQQSEAGLREEALASIQRAVEISERLATANPAAFDPDLAMSLNNLSNQQSEAGLREEALTSIQRAVEIRERLASANPATFEPVLAGSLNNLANRQSEAGLLEEAFASIQRAVEISERLASANPAAFERHLAGSLNDLSNRQSEAGLREEALASIQRAVEILERLARTNPAAFDPDLAMSLYTLAIRQSEAGLRKEALVSIQRAVEIHGRLASANPAAFEPDLAGSLNNLAIRQSEAGLREEALASIQRAAEISERLASANPASFEPDLAESLNNLSVIQSKAGLRKEALASIQRAVKIFERLASANPATFERYLATSLSNLADTQSEAGLRKEALASIQRAVQIYERLASANPATFERYLATSLSNLADTQSEAGLRKEALASITEAVRLFERLRETDSQVDLIPAWSAVCSRAELLTLNGQPDTARGTLREWLPKVLRAGLDSDRLLRPLLGYLAHTENEEARELQALIEASDEGAEVAGFLEHVLNLIDAAEPKAGSDRKGGPGARRRKAESRIPPELRGTVLETVERILAARRKARKEHRG